MTKITLRIILSICFLFVFGWLSFMGCCSKNSKVKENALDVHDSNNEYKSVDNGGRLLVSASNDTIYINSVKGHEEKDTIIGNFTGCGIDTLYVERVVGCECSLDKEYDEEQHYRHEMDDELVRYYLTSTDSSLGKVELFGYATLAPLLVNEGDLDGNGTCEVGYLPVWRLSQWRVYTIFTFKDGEWKYLIDPDTSMNDENEGEFLLETGYLLRGSGYDIANPSSKRGLVRIKYQTHGVKPVIKDTLVTPDYKEFSQQTPN